MEQMKGITTIGRGIHTEVPIKATNEGSVHATDSKRLLKVVKVDLTTGHDKELIFSDAFNELAVNRLDSPVTINFVDAENASMDLSILRITDIVTASNKLWLTSTAGEGSAEIWIWG